MLSNNGLNMYAKSFVFLASAILLSACGSGDGKSTDADKPVDPVVAKGFSDSDFERQVYITKEFENALGSALFFKADKRGVEYLDDDPSRSIDFSWEVKDKKLEINKLPYSLESTTGNTYQVRKNGKALTLYKAKALKLADLNNIILKYIKPGGCNGIERTLKITGKKAVVKDKCTNQNENVSREMTVSAVAGIDNAIEFTEGESKVIMLLTDGNLKSGNVTQVYSTKNILDYVELEAIETVLKEAF